ncbi:MAG: DUF805 domain-containing protein [Nanoarchaeota archaeon]|nr:DUF805 domain-containing protein [Nanoarchaeota archaeon]
MSWYFEVLKKYAVFAGRARRKEYWYFCLFNAIFSIVLSIIDVRIWGFQPVDKLSIIFGLGLLGGLYSLAVLIPSLAVTIRRFHDTGKSGWWLLISLVPFVGCIVLLIFLVRDSEPGENRWGANPKDVC